MTKQRDTVHRHGKTFWGIDGAMFGATLVASVLLTAFPWGEAWSAPRADARSKAMAVVKTDAGFLVVAPDRGFVGNEETRDAFEDFADGRNAALVFVTDARTREGLETALTALKRNGARRAVVLPFFLSAADPRYALTRRLLDAGVDGQSGSEARATPVTSPIPLTFARPFGESYLAVEILADRFRAIQAPAGKRVVVVGYGAKDADNRARLETDWQRLAEHAARGFGFSAVRTVVWYERRSGFGPDARREESVRALAQAADGANAVVVPFHLGRKLDSMMSFSRDLERALPPGAEMSAEEVTPHPLVATWMAREANRALPLQPGDIGVVLHAHGSDHHWNETMRAGVRALEGRYKIEYAFSMADPPTLERAVRRLEQRGARAIVIVRVFGLESTFRDDIERLIGLDVERASGAGDMPSDPHVGDGGHGHVSGPPLRIRSAAAMSTVGGVGDHPLFARALLNRARALSKDRARETVILTAHGAGDDTRNARWFEVLESLAARMRAEGGSAFRAIQVATWREDWPGKREPWIAKVRQMVEEATRDGGRALVIPARTNAQGPEREFLEGLDYALGSGFAPHPLFAHWVEEQIRNGVSAIENETIPRNAVAGRPGADGRAQSAQELSHTGANHDGR